MVRQRVMRIASPAAPPATAISSTSIASFCGPVNMTMGAAPTTMAIGIFSLRSRYFSQCRKPPAPVASRATMRHHRAVGRFQRDAIGAHVADAAVGVLGDAERRGEIRRGVEARRRHRHRQGLEPFGLQRVAGDDDLLARRVVGGDRRDRMRDRRHPGLADLLDRAAHAERVDRGRRRQRADHHRHVVFAALGVDDVGEQEGAALILRHAADELPAHQRDELGVLVDRPVDADEQPGGFQIGQMLLQVETRARGFWAGGFAAGSWRPVCRAWLDCLATDGVDPSTPRFQAGRKCSGRQARKHEARKRERPQRRSGFHLFPHQLSLVDGAVAVPLRRAVGRRRDRRGQPRRPRVARQDRRRQRLVRGMGAHGRRGRGARPRCAEEGPHADRRGLPDARGALLPDRRAVSAARAALAGGLQESGEVVRRRRGDAQAPAHRVGGDSIRRQKNAGAVRASGAGGGRQQARAGAGVLRRLRHHQGDPIFQRRAGPRGARHRLSDRRRTRQRRERALPRSAADRRDGEIRHRGLRISGGRGRRSMPSASA